MKTIFLTAFEGVEAKNLLRTTVLDELLNEKDVSIVVLTKSEERVAYYQEQFKDGRLRYEVVVQSAPRGLDKFFAGLKFTALRTKTTLKERRVAYTIDGRVFKYYGGLFLNFLLSRAFAQSAIRFFDFLLVRNETYRTIFDTYSPEVVVMAHLFDEPEVHLLREAKRRGVSSVGFINSWDKVTTRCILRLLPDRLLVFNDIVKKELEDYDAVPPKIIDVVGLPQYDYFFQEHSYSSREDFFKKINIPADHQLIVYAPLGSSFTDADWKMIDGIRNLLETGKCGEKTSLLVRFQPNDFIDIHELKKRPWLRYDYPGKRFSGGRGIDWDMNEHDLLHLKDTLHYMSLLVCFASSISVDAAVFDKPVINFNIPYQGNDPRKSPTQYFEREHYKHALETGGICLVGSMEDLEDAIRVYLTNPKVDQEGRRRLVLEQCKFTDGRSGERIASIIISQIHGRKK